MATHKNFSMDEEFAGMNFHSVQLENRFIRTMETLKKQPDTSIGYGSENRAEAKAIYRMLGNDGFDREATIRRMAEYGGPILGPGYHHTHVKTEGIGYMSDKSLGVNIHTCLAVTGDGLVLRVLDQSSYNRPEAKDESASHKRKKVRLLEEKERFRWLETLERSTADIPEGIKVITVCDREGEWKLLYCIVNKSKKEPKKPHTIKEAVEYLGWLGGPKRAPRDGPPGVKTVWIGLMKLYILLAYREYLA